MLHSGQKPRSIMRFPKPFWVLLPLLTVGGRAETLQARIAAHPSRPAPAAGQDLGEEVTYHSGPYDLKGTVFKPEGRGPFPAILWNHGSNKNPGPQPELAAFYTSHGFVLFTPIRHGHGSM